jgi:hypothetical protein
MNLVPRAQHAFRFQSRSDVVRYHKKWLTPDTQRWLMPYVPSTLNLSTPSSEDGFYFPARNSQKQSFPPSPGSAAAAAAPFSRSFNTTPRLLDWLRKTGRPLLCPSTATATAAATTVSAPSAIAVATPATTATIVVTRD